MTAIILTSMTTLQLYKVGTILLHFTDEETEFRELSSILPKATTVSKCQSWDWKPRSASRAHIHHHSPVLWENGQYDTFFKKMKFKDM